MATRFQVKRSSVSGVRPTTSDIQPGELAVNINDRILFSANTTTVFEVGSNLTSVAVGNSTVRFTVNATHVAVSNSMALSANGSNGISGQVLTSNGTGLYWSFANAGLSSITSQTFTANGTQTSFTISGGYIPSAIEVYVSGVKQVPGVDVTVTSGSTVDLAVAPLAGQIVDVFGYKSTGSIAGYLPLTGGQLGGNLTFANAAVIIASGSFGTNGQVLTSNGSSMYWSSAGFTNGQSISVNNFVITGALTANGGNGTSGQVLTSNGSGVYWAPAAAGTNTAAQYTWTNTHTFQNTVTFSTANAIILPVGNTASRPTAANGMIRYNTNTGLVEVVASSTWTGLMSAYSTVREQFTASNNQTTFTVSGGYLPGQIDVYYNGVKLRNGTEVTTSSGSTIVLATGAANNALVEVVGAGPSFLVSNTAQIVYQQYTATSNQTTFAVTGGYVPGLVDVFVDGVRMVNGADVNVSSGTSVVLTTGVPNGSVVEVKGYSTPLVSTQSTTAVRQTFTANSTVNNNFTVAGGYIAGQVDVYYNGAKLVNGTDVNTSSGTTIVLTSNAAAGAVVDVVGINYYSSGGGVVTPVRQTFVANSTTNTTFTVLSGYSPGHIDVYRNGVKMVPGIDVNVSSGNTITLTTAAANGDTVEVVGFSAVALADAVRKSGDTMTGPLTVTSTITDSIGNVRDAPVNAQTAVYQIQSTDAGRTITATANVTVNGAVLYAGFDATVFNNTAGNITLVSGAGVTMYLVGTATTGNRTLAQRGVATVRCVAANTFVVYGGGIT